jgi:hypothetical protein
MDSPVRDNQPVMDPNGGPNLRWWIQPAGGGSTNDRGSEPAGLPRLTSRSWTSEPVVGQWAVVEPTSPLWNNRRKPPCRRTAPIHRGVNVPSGGRPVTTPSDTRCSWAQAWKVAAGAEASSRKPERKNGDRTATRLSAPTIGVSMSSQGQERTTGGLGFTTRLEGTTGLDERTAAGADQICPC